MELARPVCKRCRIECDPFKAQLKRKGGGLWICNGCNAKQTLMSKMFGGMPSEFRSLSDDEQVEFFQKVKTCTHREQVRAMLIDTMVRRRVDKVTASVAGTYLPLSVCAQRGFDSSLIEQTCTDTQIHPVLGMTYRVSLVSIDRTSVEEQVREQVMQSLQKSPAEVSCSICTRG